MAEDIEFFEEKYRENYVYPTIGKLYNSIVGKCKKCDRGILNSSKKISSIKDLVHSSSDKCSCFKLYEKYKSYVISGIPKEFWKAKDHEPSIDRDSRKKINLYLSKLEGVYEQGLGILFLGSEEGLAKPNSGVGKTFLANKILQNAIDINKTAHYITMHSYFNYVYRSIDDNEYKGFVDEINNVDFLCIDELGKLANKEFRYYWFEDVIRKRNSQLLVTILITNMNKEELQDFVGLSVMDRLKNEMIEISLVGKSFRKNRFVDIKKQLKWGD